MKYIISVSLKIIIITVAIIFLISILFNYSYATDKVIQGAENFLGTGTGSTLKPANIKKASDTVYNALLAVGTIIVVIVGAVLGIQFILGSTEEKAKIKESLIPFIIGSVIIFGAFGIWKIAVTVFSEIDDKFNMEISYQEQTEGGSTTHESSSGRTHGGGGAEFLQI